MSFSVAELRNAFKERYKNLGLASTNEIDQADIDRLMADNVLCECFAKARGDLDSCLQQIEASFRWRCEDQINNLTVASFPVEALQKGSVYFRNEDREGHPIMYFRIQDCGKTTPEELRQVRQFIGWLLDKRHKKRPDNQIALLFDMTNAGLANLNFDLVRFIVRAFQVYYPKYLAYLYVYEMPWALSAAWKVIRSWLDKESQKRIVFLKRSTVQDYIPPDKLWAHMGGTDEYKYQYTPGMFEDETPDVFVDIEQSLQQQPQSLNIRQRSVGAVSNAARSSGGPETDSNSTQTGGIHAGAMSTYIGRYMSISPADRVNFRPTGGQQAGASGSFVEAQRILTFTSTSQQSVLVFKVKTTCPADYKVRPSCGLLDPGTSVAILVTYKPVNPPSQALVRADKFQILACPVASGLSKEAALEALRAAPADSVMEHRLLCRIELPELANSSKQQQRPQEDLQELVVLQAEVSRLSSIVSKMSAQHSQRLAYAKYSLVLLAFLCLCSVFILGWSFGRSLVTSSIVTPASPSRDL